MKLSTRGRYATRLMLELARSYGGAPVQMKEVSTRQGISQKYLEQLVLSLKRAGLVQSTRGPRGGHRLSRDPGKITIGEILRFTEAKEALVDCVRYPDRCKRSDGCAAKLLWTKATEAIYSQLDNITLEEALKGDFRELEKEGKDVHGKGNESLHEP